MAISKRNMMRMLFIEKTKSPEIERCYQKPPPCVSSPTGRTRYLSHPEAGNCSDVCFVNGGRKREKTHTHKHTWFVLLLV